MKLLNYSESYGSVGDRFRARRFKFFETCIEELDTPLKVLDVGGKESFWTNRGFQKRKEVKITLLNLSEEPTSHSHFNSIIGDATDLKRFGDNEFDIVFSNSVIEHLYTYDNQKLMADECMRVGKKYFIQTPNKYFFIEPHFRLPFFNFLPKRLAFYILTKTKLSLSQKWNPENASEILKEIRLLSKNEMQSLFKNSYLFKERFLIFTKSYTVHNFRHDK